MMCIKRARSLCQFDPIAVSTEETCYFACMEMTAFRNAGYSRSHHHHHLYLFKDLASWPVPVQNLFSETYESIGQLVGLLGRGIGPTQGLYLHTGQHNTEKRRHTSIPPVGFEPTIPVFERPKTVCASDRSAIGTGYSRSLFQNLCRPLWSRSLGQLRHWERGFESLSR
jgi:hypothetical protein